MFYKILIFSTLIFTTHANLNCEKNLKSTIKSIKKSCGQVCDTSNEGVEHHEHFNHVTKQIKCKPLFENEEIDEPSQYPRPPKYMPVWLENDFSYGGKVPVEKFYFDDAMPKRDYIWDMAFLNYVEKTGFCKNYINSIDIIQDECSVRFTRIVCKCNDLIQSCLSHLRELALRLHLAIFFH